MAKKGKPKIFTQEEFRDLVLEYMDTIYEGQNHGEKDTPTFFGFYKFVNTKQQCSYRTICRCFDEYWQDIKKEFESIRADLLSRGASMGVYNVTMIIFALKNWCNWKDKAEPETTTASEEQTKMLDAIKKAVTDADK